MAGKASGTEFTSVYNEGMFQIQRLHYLWAQANNQSRMGEYKRWLMTLHTIWRELSRDALKKESGKLTPGDYAEVARDNKWFAEYRTLNNTIAKASDLESYYASICDLEIFLRSLQDAVGKGGKSKDEGEDDME